MPGQFSFRARIISVIDDKRVCVRVDSECIDGISAIVSAANDKTTFKDTIVVNVNACRFTIKNIEWNTLYDLIGVHIKILAVPRKYNFWRTKEVIDVDETNHKITVKYKGVSIIAQQISNILE